MLGFSRSRTPNFISFPLKKFNTVAQCQLRTQWISVHLVCRTSFLVLYPYLTLSKLLGFSRSRTPNVMAWCLGVREMLTSVYSMLSFTFLWFFVRFFHQAASVGLWANHGSWYRQQLLSRGCILTHIAADRPHQSKVTFPQHVTSHGAHNENIYISWEYMTSQHRHIFIFGLSIGHKTWVLRNVEKGKGNLIGDF
jgi:hypothetical protein